MNHKQQILQKIESNTEIVGIIGLGYVGLPLAVNFAHAGVKVIGFDKNPEKVAKINQVRNIQRYLLCCLCEELKNFLIL